MKLRIERIDPGMGLEQFRLFAPHTEPLDAVDLGAVLAGETVGVTPRVSSMSSRAESERRLSLPSGTRREPCARASRHPLRSRRGARVWPGWQRPIRLFARPEPLLRVIALLPDHPPRRFAWRGRDYRVVAGDGPERDPWRMVAT